MIRGEVMKAIHYHHERGLTLITPVTRKGIFFVYEERGITFITLIDREELLSSSMERNHLYPEPPSS